MPLPFLSLHDVTALHGEEIQDAVRRTVSSGWYLQGRENELFEQEYAAYIGTTHCVGCANGLDAIILIFRAYVELGILQRGDEVLVPANTYIATLSGITQAGLTPVPVEPRPDTLQLDDSRLAAHLTSRTRALCLVHLYGRQACTPAVLHFCQRHGLLLVEDNAQGHGCRYLPTGQRTGSLGHAAAHSFYPGKNLGALGDGGAVTTSDAAVADVVRQLANYGQSRKYVFDYIGRNSRLDEIQAAVLRVKLRYLDDDNARRRQVALRYCEGISHPDVVLPFPADGTLRGADNVFHLFPILATHRDALQQHLTQRGIGTMIHYPIPPHRQRCYPELHDLQLPITDDIAVRELSLPIGPAITDDEVQQVIAAVNAFGA